MKNLRRSDDRGKADNSWLSTRYSFSFANYYDPDFMGYRALRVINEDIIQPGQGFGMHSHDNMEILTYIISGQLQHQDSLGNGSIIHEGDIQLMSAGSGVTHSEFNPSKTEPVHLLQIWIEPNVFGEKPTYAEVKIVDLPTNDLGKLLVSPEGMKSALMIRQMARVYLSDFTVDQVRAFKIEEGRGLWFQIIGGEYQIIGTEDVLKAGDGLSVEKERDISLKAIKPGECFVFDLG